MKSFLFSHSVRLSLLALFLFFSAGSNNARADGGAETRGGIVRTLPSLRNCIYLHLPECKEIPYKTEQYQAIKKRFEGFMKEISMLPSEDPEACYERDLSVLTLIIQSLRTQPVLPADPTEAVCEENPGQ